MKICNQIVILMLTLLVSLTGWANTTGKSKKPWTGNIQLGGVMNTGNTQAASANGKLALEYQHKKWQNSLSLAGQLSSSNGALSGSRVDFLTNNNYFFKKKRFAFGNGTAVFDWFSPYNYVVTIATGYGWRLIDTPKAHLDLQLGPGWRESKVRVGGNDESDFIVQPQASLAWNISKATKFKQVIMSDIGKVAKRYSLISSQTSLQTNIIGNLGMQLGYTMEYHTSIPVGSKNSQRLDTTTTIALIYSF